MNHNEEGLKIVLTGDSIIARRIGVYEDEPTKELVKLIKDADVSFTNLEVLPNDFQGHPAARSDGAHFAAHSWVLDELVDMGFNLFSVANNHALDYGVEGLLATFKELEDRNMSYAGAGRNLADSRMPVYYDTDAGSVAMISCTSTFFEEQSAGDQSPEAKGRPGVNPLHFDVVYEVTEEQLSVLRQVSDDLGLETQRKEWVRLGFAADTKDASLLPLVDSNLRVAGTLNANFRAAEKAAVRTVPNAQDLAEIVKWVKEAKSRADIVIVSLHAHEQGDTREQPAEFIQMFARSVIDAGADIVVGHGPHLLRGMELYEGKPIFYSIGNFIGQNELIYKLPADSYKRFGIDKSLAPSEVFRIRSQDGKKGFPGDSLYWQTVVPVCRFEDGKLVQLDITPVELTYSNKPYKRGRPCLAKGQRAEEILQKFSELSSEFGTKIDENGRVVL